MPRPRLSFEFFPPANLAAEARLGKTVDELAPFGPEFVSVTCGAGGTTRALTLGAAKGIHADHGLTVAAHLTCVGAPRERILSAAQNLADSGVREILALRGDPPKGQDRFLPQPGGFRDTCELVSALADIPGLRIRVSAYPDPHPDAAYASADVDWLKRKLDAGAGSAITQFFFEAETYFRFRDACRRAGIDAPIIPGILPVQNWETTRGFARRCGAHIPDWLDGAFRTALRDGGGRHDILAVSVCTELCSELIDGGAGHLHFYTLNRPRPTREVIQALGLSPAGEHSETTGIRRRSRIPGDRDGRRPESGCQGAAGWRDRPAARREPGPAVSP